MNVVQLLVSFQGRINREAYWLAIVPLMLAGIFGWVLSSAPAFEAALLGNALGLSVVWPLFAVNVKRWHDRDKSGLWTLIGAIPVAGQVWTLIECGLMPGTSGYNAYGEPPSRLLLLEQTGDSGADSGDRKRGATEAAELVAERVAPDFASLMRMAGLMTRSDSASQAEKFLVIRGYLSGRGDLDGNAVEDAIAIAWGSRFSRDSFEANADVVKTAYEKGGGESHVEVDTAGLNTVANFLFELAMVDETLSENEEILLAQLHAVFGFFGSSHSSHTQIHGSWRPESASHVPVGERRRYYGEVLGLENNITPEGVKAAFRELVKQYHPDKVAHLGPKLTEAADEEMRKINEAYEYFNRTLAR